MKNLENKKNLTSNALNAPHLITPRQPSNFGFNRNIFNLSKQDQQVLNSFDYTDDTYDNDGLENIVPLVPTEIRVF